MFGLSLKQAKAGFFDRAAVIAALDKTTRKALSNFGGWVRTTAKRSIRGTTKDRKQSSPGEPPINRTGLLRKFIFYSFDLRKRTVVIGPTKLNGKDSTFVASTETGAELLEHGGQATILESKWPGNYMWNRADLHNPGRLARKETRRRTITVSARPFMNPAFELGKKELPRMFKDAATHIATK